MSIRPVPIVTGFALVAALAVAAPAAGAPAPDRARPGPLPEVSAAVQSDVSPPLRDLAPLAPAQTSTRPTETTQRPIPDTRIEALNYPPKPVPVEADPPGPTTMPTATSFEGISNINGVLPPDTDGDVGPNHYVQMVNLSFQVFSKSGTSLYGPAANNTLWSGFGGACQTENDGDPIVLYDQFADRWLMSQFAIPGGATKYECVAVSTSGDPTSTWYRFAFAYGTDIPDYPKFGVWPDGYYVTYNMFPETGPFLGTKVCALDRAKMLVGDPSASQQCFDQLDTGPNPEWSLLPSDADGPTPPPAGSPNYVIGEDYDETNKLTMYKFHVDWTTPANSTFTGPITIPVDTFTWACLGVTRGRCVPQPDTSVKLESLGGRTMFRLAYRNFGTHESLVTNHTVAMDGAEGQTTQTGVGWYEIRSPGTTPVVHQEGTSADPDGSTFRWMASMAMDGRGNMALGYSKSKATVTYPSIAMVGREATDPLGTMPQAEAVIQAGGGSQTHSAARWGDYSAMSVDPVDDCTFWYTNEYLQTTGSAPWRTRIAKFIFPSCLRPSEPTGVQAVRGNGQVAVSWTAPTYSGTSAMTGYTATATPGGSFCTVPIPGPTSCTITGLTNGTAYTINVTATNASGPGTPGTAGPVTPATIPNPPTGVSAVGGDGLAVASWSSGGDGGSAITSYTATATPGGATCTTPAGASPAPTSCTIPGLTNGSDYTVTVTATNAVGTSGSSAASAPVRPAFAVLQVTASPTTAKPGQSVSVSVGQAGPGCTLTFGLSGSSATATAGATGSASASVTAPKPNGPYQVTVVQSGAGCPGLSATVPVTVSGPYITGPAKVKAGKKATFKGKEFTKKKKVSWTVTKKGKTVASGSAKASKKGVSTYSVTLSKKGTYTVTAKQKGKKATYSVKVT